MGRSLCAVWMLASSMAYAQLGSLSHDARDTEDPTVEGSPQGLKIDAADLKTLPIAEILRGFRGREVTFKFKGENCRIHFFMHRNIDKGAPPTLLIHGFSDAGNGYSPLVKSMIKSGVPYSNLMWVDWPHHGRTNCEQAGTFQEATEAVHQAIDLLNEKEKMQPPKLIIGHSMGTTMSALLAKNYPNARLVWLAPPILQRDDMDELVDFASHVKTADDGKRWVELVGKDPVPRVPLRRLPVLKQVDDSIHWIAYKTMVKRVQRAQSVLTDFKLHPETLDEVAQAMADIDPDRVTIVVGKNDALTPWRLEDKRIHDKFNDQINTVNCGHNVHRDCPQEVVDILVKADVFSSQPKKGFSFGSLSN